jgi:hypothetical protein
MTRTTFARYAAAQPAPPQAPAEPEPEPVQPAEAAGPAFWAPSSPGDLADRWTILSLKVARCDTEAKRDAAERLLGELRLPVYDSTCAALFDALGRVNEQLWDLEDTVRRHLGDPYGAQFVEAARRVPVMNDTRAHLKARIDELMGHAQGDVKSYS